MAIAMPHIFADARFLKARLEPRASIKSALASFSRKDWIGRMLSWTLERFESGYRI